MKIALILCLASAATVAHAETSSTKSKAPAARTAPAEVKIPAGAVKGEDGSYKFTDEKGKKWIYRETPFGIAKSEDKSLDPAATPFGAAKPQDKSAAAPAPAATEKDPATARVDGDMVYFERPSPFGVSKWQKKKSELTPSEQKILDQQKSAK
jgi:hypothetical protein